jgi:ketosteroid isomerase-like protein
MRRTKEIDMTALPTAVQRLLDGLSTGDWDGMEAHLTPDASQDGSMPGWRVRYQGPAQIVEAFRTEWTNHGTWEVTEQHVTRGGDTVVVDLEVVTRPGSGPRLTVRMANIFELRDGRIAEHRYYCAGEWDEATLRRIEAEAPRIEHAPTT